VLPGRASVFFLVPPSPPCSPCGRTRALPRRLQRRHQSEPAARSQLSLADVKPSALEICKTRALGVPKTNCCAQATSCASNVDASRHRRRAFAPYVRAKTTRPDPRPDPPSLLTFFALLRSDARSMWKWATFVRSGAPPWRAQGNILSADGGARSSLGGPVCRGRRSVALCWSPPSSLAATLLARLSEPPSSSPLTRVEGRQNSTTKQRAVASGPLQVGCCAARRSASTRQASVSQLRVNRERMRPVDSVSLVACTVCRYEPIACLCVSAVCVRRSACQQIVIMSYY
jgi:hypothetical protein